MVLYTIKILLPIKDILKHSHPVVSTITLKFCKDSVLEQQEVKELGKME